MFASSRRSSAGRVRGQSQRWICIPIGLGVRMSTPAKHSSCRVMQDRTMRWTRSNASGVLKWKPQWRCSVNATVPRTDRFRLIQWMSHMRFTLLLLAMVVTLTASSCASLDEPGFEIPRGTPINHDQIPEVLRNKLSLPSDASVERYGDDPSTAGYRIEYNNGTVTTIGSDGTLHGMLM